MIEYYIIMDTISSYSSEQTVLTADFQLQSQQDFCQTMDSENMNQPKFNPKRLLKVCQIMHTTQEPDVAIQNIQSELQCNQTWKTQIEHELNELFSHCEFQKAKTVTGPNQQQANIYEKQAELKNIGLFALHLINSFLKQIGKDQIKIPKTMNFYGVLDYFCQKPSPVTQDEFVKFLEQNFGYCLTYLNQEQFNKLLENPPEAIGNTSVQILSTQIKSKGIELSRKSKRGDMVHFNVEENRQTQAIELADFFDDLGGQKVEMVEGEHEDQQNQKTDIQSNQRFPLLLVDGQLIQLKLNQATRKLGVDNDYLLMMKSPKFLTDLLDNAKLLVKQILDNPYNGFVQSYYKFFTDYQTHQNNKKKMHNQIKFDQDKVKCILLDGLNSVIGIMARSGNFYGLTQNGKIYVNLCKLVQLIHDLDQEDMIDAEKHVKSLSTTSLCITILHELTHFTIRKIGLVKEGFGSFTNKRKQIRKKIKKRNSSQENPAKGETKNKKEDDITGESKSQMLSEYNIIRIDLIEFKLIKFVLDHRNQFDRISIALKDTKFFYQQAEIYIFEWQVREAFSSITLDLLNQLDHNEENSKQIKNQFARLKSELKSEGLDQLDLEEESKTEVSIVELVNFKSLIQLYLKYQNDRELIERFSNFKTQNLLSLYKKIKEESEIEINKLVAFFVNRKISSLSQDTSQALDELKIINQKDIAIKVFGRRKYQSHCMIITNIFQKVGDLGRKIQKGIMPKCPVRKIEQIVQAYLLQKYLGQFVSRCVNHIQCPLDNVLVEESGWIMEDILFPTLRFNSKTIFYRDQDLLMGLAESKSFQNCLEMRWRFGNKNLNKKPSYQGQCLSVARKGVDKIPFLKMSTFCLTSGKYRNH